MYDDRPYVTERPDALRRLWDTCARAGQARAATPSWNLDRWKVVRDLIVAWYADDRPDHDAIPDIVDNLAGWMDPVQRSVAERLFGGWRAMYPKDSDVLVDLDPPALAVVDHEAGVELRVSPSFALTYPDGSVELIRLRTGQSGSGPDDAAVMAQAAESPVTIVDAMVAHGAAEEITAPVDGDERIAQLVALAGRDRRVPLRPGVHCFGCDSVARCGHYPILGEGRVFVSTRSITVSKSQLGWLDTCRRRVAWDRVYAVPIDRDGDLEPGAGLAAGLRFHETAAAGILADDPQAVLDHASRAIDPSEASELRRLWDNHCTLWAEDGEPEARTTEFPAGLTILTPGVHVDSRGRESTQPVAVTFIGILDVTGREPDGTPMVVEHRTGRSGEHAHLEAELYAVSAAETVRRSTGAWPDRLTVHLHHLRAEPPTCRRTEFTTDDLERAAGELRRVAAVVAGWHPGDSLSPDFEVGPWCESCPHRSMCENHR